jgi:hypothetical protein
MSRAILKMNPKVMKSRVMLAGIISMFGKG